MAGHGSLQQPELTTSYTQLHTSSSRSQASCLSRLCFSWLNPLIATGVSRQLDLCDLDALDGAADDTCAVVGSFARSWSARASLFGAFWAQFGRAYVWLALLKLCSDALMFSGPILLEFLVQFIEDHHTPEAAPMWHGYALGGALVGCALLGAVVSTQYQYMMQRLCLRVRAAVVGAIYEQTVHLNEQAKREISAGRINNVMSVDTQQLMNVVSSFHEFWSLPVQIGIALWLLYRQVGLAVFAGVGVVVLLIPLNAYLTKLIAAVTAKLMVAKDERIDLTNEMLHHIRTIILFAWQPLFVFRILDIRQRELYQLKVRKYLDAFCVYFWATTPVLVSLSTFSLYSAMGHDLTASKVFTSLALFNTLIHPLNAFPWVINGIVEGSISIYRIQDYLQARRFGDFAPDVASDSGARYRHATRSERPGAIQLNGASFFGSLAAVRDDGSDSDDQRRLLPPEDAAAQPVLLLRDVSFSITPGEFVCVTGVVGSGKSVLLQALLGELLPSRGQVILTGSLAYVPQEPWICSGTIRENIVFGLPYNAERYERCLFACSLLPDLERMERGDLTVIGTRGINLSGGQRARLSLARAVYRECDIYLLDDPLSALDAHVAAHVAKHCLHGLLAGSTRVLVTHDMSVARTAQRVFSVDGELHTVAEVELAVPASPALAAAQEPPPVHKSSPPPADDSDAESVEDLITTESREAGAIRTRVLRTLLHSVGIPLVVLILASLVLMQASRNFNDYWLSLWVRHASDHPHDTDTNYYLHGLFYIAGANTVLTLVRAFSFAYGGLVAARRLFSRLLLSITTASTSFFDRTPAGRILNRFSTDTYAIDEQIPFQANILLAQSFGLLGALAIISTAMPEFLVLVAVLGVVYYRMQLRYRASSRELRRLDSVSRSPIYSHFGETLDGSTSIRALRVEPMFVRRNLQFLDDNQRVAYVGLEASQWLSFRLRLLAVCVVGFSAGFALVVTAYGDGIDPAKLGLALAYALPITSNLSGLIGALAETEKEIVSVERVREYIDSDEIDRDDPDATVAVESDSSSAAQRQLEAIAAEWSARASADKRASRPAWLKAGEVVFDGFSLQYRRGLEPALDNINLRIPGGAHVGIVGHTSAGKSSLIQALFRTRSLTRGRVLIDGVDTSTIPLGDLRRSMSVVPQAPTLFSGSLRDNLDPLHEHSDAAIWDALARCGLDAKVRERLHGLDSELQFDSELFSVGERQLVCLVRALLRECLIVCLDEASSAVDPDTDRQIQHVVRSAFADCTVLIIAHRLQTVRACDLIVVMQNGHVAETGTPTDLLSNPDSLFASMVAVQSGSG